MLSHTGTYFLGQPWVPWQVQNPEVRLSRLSIGKKDLRENEQYTGYQSPTFLQGLTVNMKDACANNCLPPLYFQVSHLQMDKE